MPGFRERFTDSNPSMITQFLRWGLRLGVPVYALAIWVRNKAYDWGWKDAYSAGIPVVSVGNLSAGGTGKSPAVAWLASWFRERGIRVAILSRGYGQLADGQNDEALELEMRFPDVPHLQHWDRIQSAQLAEEELEMQVLLLDDGFQHRRLARSLDLVLIDATDSRPAQWLLPGGIYREPISSLKRADIVILTRADQASADQMQRWQHRLRNRFPDLPVLLAKHQPTNLVSYPDTRHRLPLSNNIQTSSSQSHANLPNSVLAFCGIGNPESFYDTCRAIGFNVLATQNFPDHHAYDRSDIKQLKGWCEAYPGAQMILCTMKDLVKLQTKSIGGVPLHAVEISMNITHGETALQSLLDRVLESILEGQATS